MIRNRPPYALVFILCLSLLCPARLTHAQTYRELYAETLNMQEDSNTVKACIRLYDKYYVVNADSLAEGMNLLLKAHHTALKINDISGIIETSYRIAGNLIYFKNETKAIEYYFKGLKFAESNGLYSKTGKAYEGIGLIFYTQKKWNEALHYFQKAIELNDKFSGKAKKSIPIYLSGLCNNEKKEFNIALTFLNKALQIASAEKDSNRIYECYLGIAKAMANLNQTNEALEYYNKAGHYYTKLKAPQAYTSIHLQMGDIYMKKGELKIALKETLEAYETNKLIQMQPLRDEITELLSGIYAKLGDKDKAYAFLLENKLALDSSRNRDIISEIAVSEAKYNFEKKETLYAEELESGKRKKNMALMFMSLFGGLILLGSYFYIVLRKERKKSENLLLNILPESTAAELKKYGRAIATHHESVSIMFCDVKSFTKISENLSPELLVKMLDLYISAFDDIITSNHLEKIKTIGDAYMCAGGLATGQQDHAVKVVKAAIEILAYVESSAEAMRAEFGDAFQLRIGIHTGPVVSGIVGSKKYAYDIWGDTVNIAARMEQKSEPGQINISASTKELISQVYKTVYRGKISAKNKAEMDMYFIDLTWKGV